jgi:hypothetical protein
LDVLKERLADFQKDIDHLKGTMEFGDKSKSGVQVSEGAGVLSIEVTGPRIENVHAILEKLWRLQKKLINDLEVRESLEETEIQQESEKLVSIEEGIQIQADDELKEGKEVPVDKAPIITQGDGVQPSFENGSRIDVLVSQVQERVGFGRKHASLYRGR